VTAFLAARAVAGMERVNPGYRRVVSIGKTRGDTVGVVEVTPGSDGVTLSVSPSLTGSLSEVVARTRRVFDVDADPQAISTQLSRDPALATAVARCPGLPVAGAWDGYEMTVRAIVGQQVSVAAARSVLSRITAAYGEPADIDGETWVAFPTAQRLARARLERLGVIASRARAIREVSRRVADGSLDIDGGREPGRVVEALTAIPGVGPWTASMVAMRALGDPDAFPVTDLGLLKAAREVLGTRTVRELEKRAERWRPWRAYAAAYLWQDAV
jgi:AraC family transcriptional regulator of adaptative response / DNA-3-methyladenine glycosylase II